MWVAQKTDRDGIYYSKKNARKNPLRDCINSPKLQMERARYYCGCHIDCNQVIFDENWLFLDQ